MKKVILLVCLTVIVIGGIGLTVFLCSSKQDIPQIEPFAEQKEENKELSTEEIEIVEETEPIEEESVVSEQEKSEENKIVPEKKNDNSSSKQENNTGNVPKTEPKKEEPTPPKQEEPKVEEDSEYLRLLGQVQYKTYEECMKAGFDIAEKDTVNIAGFSCPYIVYKGQILGYRLEITYY